MNEKELVKEKLQEVIIDEFINDINEIRESVDLEELNEICFNTEVKWMQRKNLNKKLDKFINNKKEVDKK